jgi:hypothetical protein
LSPDSSRFNQRRQLAVRASEVTLLADRGPVSFDRRQRSQ